MRSDKTIAIAIGAVIVVVVVLIVFAIAGRDGDEQTTENGQTTTENGQVSEDSVDQAGQELPALAEVAAAKFTDVSLDADYAAAVGWLLENNLTTGCSEDSFCSDQLISRQQFVTFLWRAAGSPDPSERGSEIFNDIAATSYADKAIGWAAEEDITTGCRTEEDGSRFFCSDNATSRAHAAAFLYRYVGATYEVGEESGFEDVEADAYYADAAGWLAGHGLDEGCTDSNFCPGEPLTRAQAAVLIHGVAETPAAWGTDGILRSQ